MTNKTIDTINDHYTNAIAEERQRAEYAVEDFNAARESGNTEEMAHQNALLVRAQANIAELQAAGERDFALAQEMERAS